MALASTLSSGTFDLLVLDADENPVLAAEVKRVVEPGSEVERQLREHAAAQGIAYGLVVDRRSVRLFDLGAVDGPPLLEFPTQALLACYAHDLDAQKVSARYLERLTDTWLRNVMQPLASQPPPGIEPLRERGVAERLRGGRTIAEFKGYF